MLCMRNWAFFPFHWCIWRSMKIIFDWNYKLKSPNFKLENIFSHKSHFTERNECFLFDIEINKHISWKNSPRFFQCYQREHVWTYFIYYLMFRASFWAHKLPEMRAKRCAFAHIASWHNILLDSVHYFGTQSILHVNKNKEYNMLVDCWRQWRQQKCQISFRVRCSSTKSRLTLMPCICYVLI